MKHYKDEGHHYKVIDRHRAVTVTLLGGYETSIGYANYNNIEHHVMDYIKEKSVTPCTEAEYQTAFDKALNTIINLKNQKTWKTMKQKPLPKLKSGNYPNLI